MIDAEAANDPAVYNNIRAAASHMQMIADPLAAAIAKQFPDRFGSALNDTRVITTNAPEIPGRSVVSASAASGS